MGNHQNCKACGSICYDKWCSPVMIFSDGKQSPNTSLYICSTCGSFNKILDQSWEESCEKNYTQNYEASPHSGLPKGSHLNRILDTISNLEFEDSTEDYTILDYGMGQGDFSKYILHYHPYLKVFGYDLFPQILETSLTSNQNFTTINSYNELKSYCYDAISLIQAFEHLVDPVGTINDLAKYLKANGKILLQFPTPTFNPLDLVVYDHTCHYTYSYEMLKGLQRQLDFKSNIVCNRSNQKEMLISITPSADVNNIELDNSPCLDKLIHKSPSKTLEAFINKVFQAAAKKPFYILGTTYKSRWICELLECSFSNMIEINNDNHLEYDKSKVLIMPFPEAMAKNIASKFGFNDYISLS